MKGLKKAAVLAASSIMALSMTACQGSGGTAGEDTKYTMWIYEGVDSSYYADYRENPVLQYTLDQKWGPEEKKMDIEFWIPPAGSEADSYQTMIASGDYPDVLHGVISDAAPNLYKAGIIMDLTDYVKENMPNYYAYIQEHEDFASNVVYNIDGEDRILSITGSNEDYPYYFAGYQYRRDWIVKYGTDPETGKPFTGGYTDPEDQDSWEDDVVFPSGGTEPVYISDWEWMFEIFAKAQEDLGIKDSYGISMYYPGFTWSGGLCSSFGGGVPVWYKGEDGKVAFGGDSEQFRAYLECLNTWYQNGWLDQEFNERTSDIFYAIDDVSVRQGKVGMWMGLQSQLGGRMDMGDEFTSGICVYGCAMPINDIYGTDACKNVEPNCVATNSLTGNPYYITKAAEGKDIATLCSYFDYFYSEEGSVMYTLGLNEEQQKEADSQLYKDYGLDSGSYTVGEDGRYVRAEVVQKDGGGLKNAVCADKMPGMMLVSSVDEGYADTYEASMKSWLKYKNTAFFQGTAVTNNMTDEDAKACDNIRTKVIDYLTLNAPDMIKGAKDPFNDTDWNNWCTIIKKYNYQKASDLYQPYVDTYAF